jgi:uncharacterized protein (TIGR02147 family)
MGKSSKNSKPRIFEYANYRDFLRDYYEGMKESAPLFSFRRFAEDAGFNSPSVLKLVIDGKRNLSHDSVEKFARALKLNRDEAKFFTSLVLLNQATSTDEKRYYAEQLLQSRKYKKLNPLKPAQFDYFTHWYYVAIRELVATRGFKEDPEWIARKLRPAISPAQARTALAALEELGLLKRDENGKLVQSDRLLSTTDEVDSASVAEYHREMIRKGAESIDEFRGKDREISAATVSVDEKTAKQMKELVQRFRKELLAIAVNCKESTGVYQINLQLFPLTDSDEEDAA